jgi:hypothetical protein
MGGILPLAPTPLNTIGIYCTNNIVLVDCTNICYNVNKHNIYNICYKQNIGYKKDSGVSSRRYIMTVVPNRWTADP